MRGILTFGLIALFCVLLSVSAAHAQETTTGTIAGRVIDAQHLPVPGATITITTPQGPMPITSDADGRFYAAFLPPGSSTFDPLRATTLNYDPDFETSFQVTNPDLGTASRLNLAQLQTPRQIRFGIRYEF
jgi:hypothetical protein